jgi:hypothetical protein
VVFEAIAPCASAVNRAGISNARDAQGVLVTPLLVEAELIIREPGERLQIYLPVVRRD